MSERSSYGNSSRAMSINSQIFLSVALLLLALFFFLVCLYCCKRLRQQSGGAVNLQQHDSVAQIVNFAPRPAQVSSSPYRGARPGHRSPDSPPHYDEVVSRARTSAGGASSNRRHTPTPPPTYQDAVALLGVSVTGGSTSGSNLEPASPPPRYRGSADSESNRLFSANAGGVSSRSNEVAVPPPLSRPPRRYRRNSSRNLLPATADSSSTPPPSYEEVKSVGTGRNISGLNRVPPISDGGDPSLLEEVAVLPTCQAASVQQMSSPRTSQPDTPDTSVTFSTAGSTSDVLVLVARFDDLRDDHEEEVDPAFCATVRQAARAPERTAPAGGNDNSPPSENENKPVHRQRIQRTARRGTGSGSDRTLSASGYDDLPHVEEVGLPTSHPYGNYPIAPSPYTTGPTSRTSTVLVAPVRQEVVPVGRQSANGENLSASNRTSESCSDVPLLPDEGCLPGDPDVREQPELASDQTPTRDDVSTAGTSHHESESHS